ncbi:hypothetical protein NM208_g11338 [Fusarium decemcellulare]|uniref:Uncharacterized protein n=1 Tax=Fusarium decemcellulare TaxID=57161 RepID=A0ACC1RUJ3_9HYPO|nr:hypothetical protein NM208_g11338 [Fusarium decemcellulare]
MIKISSSETPVRRDLLERCYARVITLREYVLANLPRGSRLRRKKVASIGHGGNSGEVEKRLSQLLDTSLVCCQEQPQDSDDTRWEQWLVFSQKEDESYVTLSDGVAGSIYSQSEIVDFVVWLLFSRDLKAGRRPKHLLCDGFRKSAGPGDQGSTNIPGLFSLYPNCHVKMLREAPWPQLLALLGKAGEKIMIDLLVDASVFVNVEAGFNNYYQLTGIPLSELDLPGGAVSLGKASANECRKSSDITLVRSRIFYAKPSLTARGLVQPGFKHIHVLNRCSRGTKLNDPCQPTTDDQRRSTIKVMMYMFPRQFGLHNVFTSQVDTSKTAQKFQDYTLREEEIAPAFQPKTGQTAVRHGRCSYIELLKYYCPCVFDKSSRSRKPRTKKDAITPHKTRHNQPSMTVSHHKAGLFHKHSGKPSATQVPNLPHYKSLVDLAAPASQVSTFCQAVLSKIIPHKFWGGEEVQKHNESVVMQRVDHFIKLRRFETMSLHEISQDLKVTNIDWLQPPGLKDQKPSKTDTEKRHEIFFEFLYFIFDSLLIPLIRNNFYVTESNTHRYQIFYFRHEVWKHIAEPAMANLKADMFEEIKLDDALHVLQSRRLGFSQVRLLPKGDKMRPIMNLRRRALTRGTSKVLGPSINSILGPVHTLLKLEKDTNPSKLGSTMFSVSDIYTRLKTFKESLGPKHGKLYFAKIDVKAAFDTIPQPAVIKLMGSVPRQAKYTIMKHAEVKPGERALLDGEKSSSKAIRRWHATALAKGDSSNFTTRLEQDLAGKKKNTVFVDSAMQKTHSVDELLHLLTQHVEQNLVKVGKKYYRQKVGIPQGSVLSSFLCNYFYADLEKQHLDFLDAPDTLLLRLIDDFLLVTLDQEKAVNFVNTMHKGVPEYGVVVNPAKTLVNFDMSCADVSARKIDHDEKFPYCGTTIDCRTLDITKDRQRDAHLDVSASLTVDFGRAPGQNFQRKVLNAFKIQSHLMFFDTSHNSTRTVLDSLHGAFRETANKTWAYMRCLGKAKQPRSELVIRTITKVIDVAFLLLTSKSRTMRYPQYRCDIRKSQVALVAYVAFKNVLAAKQSKYGSVVVWLRKEADRLASGKQYDPQRDVEA